MKECPDCGKGLKYQEVSKYMDDGGSKVIGDSYFCPNRKCDYQE